MRISRGWRIETSGGRGDEVAKDLQLAIQWASPQKVEQGQCVFCGESPERMLYLIRSGRIRFVIHGAQGQKKVFAILGPGDVFTNLFETRPWPPVTACALENVHIYGWNAAALETVIRRIPGFALYVLDSLMDYLHLTTSQLEALSFHPAGRRVIQTFAHLAQVHGKALEDGIRIDLPLNQAEIGEIAHASRVTVSKEYHRLVRIGVLRKRDGFFEVLNVDRLLAMVGEDDGENDTEPILARSSGGT